MQFDTNAIILRRISYGEADQIVTFFGRDEGRCAGLARSAKKSLRRFGGALEPGSIVRLCYRRRGQQNLVNLDSADITVSMHQLYRSLERISLLSEALELALGFLQEHEAAPKKFDLLAAYIASLAHQGSCDEERAYFYFSWLKLSGYEPHLTSCLSCGEVREEQEHWSFSPAQGGILCAPCSSERGEGMGIAPELKKGTLINLFRAQAEHILGKGLASTSYEALEKTPR